MSTGFVSWTAELARWKDAVANRNVESFFVASTENRNQMRTTYRRLDDIQSFTEWLEMKAAAEVAGGNPGEIPFAIGGF